MTHDPNYWIGILGILYAGWCLGQTRGKYWWAWGVSFVVLDTIGIVAINLWGGK